MARRLLRSRRWLAGMLVVVLAACRAVGQSPPASPTPPGATPSPVSTPSELPTATPSPTLDLAVPGRPYGGPDVLVAMRTSVRPDGVPTALQQDAIAAAAADLLWTFDGQPWVELVASGSCGATDCTLELSGAPAGLEAEDLYILSVTRSSGEVALVSAELRGLPVTVVDELDRFARDHWPEAPIPGALASARWLPPPEAGTFVLSYRSGGEEGSPAVDAVVDVGAGSVELRQPG